MNTVSEREIDNNVRSSLIKIQRDYYELNNIGDKAVIWGTLAAIKGCMELGKLKELCKVLDDFIKSYGER